MMHGWGFIKLLFLLSFLSSQLFDSFNLLFGEIMSRGRCLGQGQQPGQLALLTHTDGHGSLGPMSFGIAATYVLQKIPK